MSRLKILHIAPENTAGVPFNVMKMQNDNGCNSRLITFYKLQFDFPEDVCLNFALPKGKLAKTWRDYKLKQNRKEKQNEDCTGMPVYKPKNKFEQFYFNLRQKQNEKKFLNALNDVNADDASVIHFDGGICFYNDSHLALNWKKNGKKIVNCYFGDDLRTRGIVKEMNELSDLNLTFEYDHTLRHPDINFLFFPFDNTSIDYIPDDDYSRERTLTIVHAPTHRYVKGTQFIIDAIEKVKISRRINFVVLENLSRSKVIELKRKAHIAVDQIGNKGGTGYGINSLETLSMGIPTVTDMNCGMDKWLPENPFVIANKDDLADKLIELIDNEKLRFTMRKISRDWVTKYHSFNSVFEQLKKYYLDKKIIG